MTESRIQMLYKVATTALITAALNQQDMILMLRDAMNAHNATETEMTALGPMLATFMDSFAANPSKAKSYIEPGQPNSVVLHVTYIISDDGDGWNVTRLPEPRPTIEPPGWYSSMSIYVSGASNSVMTHLYWTAGDPGDAERANVEAQIVELVCLEPEIGSRRVH